MVVIIECRNTCRPTINGKVTIVLCNGALVFCVSENKYLEFKHRILLCFQVWLMPWT